MALNLVQIGPQVAGDGNTVTARGGRSGEAIVQELHGRYYETAYRKGLFAGYFAAQTLSLPAVGMTGAMVWNGTTSFNLVLQKIGVQVTVTSATLTGIALAFVLAQQAAPTGQTAATFSGSTFIGGPGPTALALNAGTFVRAPVAFYPLLHNTAAIATTGIDNFNLDFEGSIIVPPFQALALVALGAASAAAAVTAAMLWEEVPV
jgi:hypothetical protein